MIFEFVTTEVTANQLERACKDKILGRPGKVQVLAVTHFQTYSVVKLDLHGELSDLVWLGYWTHYLKAQDESLIKPLREIKQLKENTK